MSPLPRTGIMVWTGPDRVLDKEPDKTFITGRKTVPARNNEGIGAGLNRAL